jgi:uncharacterized protein
MEQMRLGRTGLMVSRSGFGALPLQRTSLEEATAILRAAHEAGITFYDTARAYTDSEEKLGIALSEVRRDIVIATKTFASTGVELFTHLETSLRNLKTDHVDILQLHNPAALPDPDDPEGLYGALQEAKRRGMTRFIGVTNHRRDVALEAARSRLYDTVQFPFNHLSSKEDIALVEECERHDVGFIAMKALSGGMVSHIPATFAYLRQFPGVLPIWGIQRMSELKEFLRLEEDPPAMDERMRAMIETDRTELAGAFCRGCGYCLPCPAGIPIPMAARLSFALTRMPWRQFMTPEWKANMERIRECRDCGHCRTHCPYGLDAPALLKRMRAEYETFYAGHAGA